MPYHVRITQKSHREHDEVKLDLGKDQLEARFLTPYLEGRPVVIGGKTIPTEDIERIRINYSDETSEELLPIVRREEEERRRSSKFVVIGGPSDEWLVADRGKDVTDEIITGPPGSGMNARRKKPSPSMQGSRETVIAGQRNSSNPDQRRVFVVHGRDEKLRMDLFSFLRSIGLNPIEFSEAIRLTGKAAPYIGEILDAAFGNAQAVIVLLSPDDEARLRAEFLKEDDSEHEKELTPQPRQNVLFEAGLAFGHNPDRVLLVKVGELRPFSDILGRHEVRLTNDARQRQEVANRLRNAGCPVNLTGTDWLTIGDFDISPVVSSTKSSGDKQAGEIQKAPVTLTAQEAQKIVTDQLTSMRGVYGLVDTVEVRADNWYVAGHYYLGNSEIRWESIVETDSKKVLKITFPDGPS